MFNLLNRELTLYRVATVPNDSGGFMESWVEIETLWCRVSQPSASEIAIARSAVGPQQGGADVYPVVYVDYDDTVYRNDELRDTSSGEVFRVESIVYPSAMHFYTRLNCHYRQAQPEPEV